MNNLNFNNIIGGMGIIVLVIALSGYWVDGKGERLYQSNFTHLESDISQSTRGADDNGLPPMLSEALSYYETKDYANAIPLLENYLESNSEDANATFYLGMAYLGNGQSDEAIKKLTIARFNDEMHYQEATWYLALSQLKSGNNTDADALLSDLAQIPDCKYIQEINALKEAI